MAKDTSLGMQYRRAVLGDTYVDKAESQRTEFTNDFQDFLTAFVWGRIWSRDGLDRRTRSLVTIALMVALNHPHELELHLSRAASNGVTADEVKEVLLHTAVYCGAPAANQAFSLASKLFGA